MIRNIVPPRGCAVGRVWAYRCTRRTEAAKKYVNSWICKWKTAMRAAWTGYDQIHAESADRRGSHPPATIFAAPRKGRARHGRRRGTLPQRDRAAEGRDCLSRGGALESVSGADRDRFRRGASKSLDLRPENLGGGPRVSAADRIDRISAVEDLPCCASSARKIPRRPPRSAARTSRIRSCAAGG